MTYYPVLGTGAKPVSYGAGGGGEPDWVSLPLPKPETVLFENQTYVRVAPACLEELAAEAFDAINHLLRPSHLKQLGKILEDPEASPNDRVVAFELLKNANIAAGGVLPMCQDTGTALISAKRGMRLLTDGQDAAHLSRGVWRTYQKKNLRYSQMAPLSMLEEKNTKSNLPAQIDIYAEGEDTYDFLFMAKGGGSANKTFLYQKTAALLAHEKLLDFLKEKVLTLGTAACPPYHLAVVVGGCSAEMTLKVAKLASVRALDGLPPSGNEHGQAFRDRAYEEKIWKMTQMLGVGAQFGGKYLCHDVRVIRLPRHGASLPIGLAVSCSADRQALGKITRQGVFLEQLEAEPETYLPAPAVATKPAEPPVAVDLSQPMADICRLLSNYPIATRLALSGPMLVARDLAHARLEARLAQGEPLPAYFCDHPIYYAGPAKTPAGAVSGAFGPTTASRMDPYVPLFQAHGGSRVMLAKGNRSRKVTQSCQRFGGFYLGSIGGPAARLAQDCIRAIEIVDYEELGMEAIRKIEVQDFPAFILIDDKGNDFFAKLHVQAED